VAANSARDVGGRLANLTIYGLKATGGKYAAIAALTNIPAMIVAVLIYEFFLTDPDRGTRWLCSPSVTSSSWISFPVIPRANLEYITVHKNHRRFDGGEADLSGPQSKTSIAEEKANRVDMYENARA